MCRFLSPLLRSSSGVISAPHDAIETLLLMLSFLVTPSLAHVATRPAHFLPVRFSSTRPLPMAHNPCSS